MASRSISSRRAQAAIVIVALLLAGGVAVLAFGADDEKTAATTSRAVRSPTTTTAAKSPAGEDAPLILENLGVNFGPFDAATKRVGDFVFPTNATGAEDDQPLLLFGSTYQRGGRFAYRGGLEYRYLDPQAKVIAVADGVVTSASRDRIEIRPSSGSVWSVTYERIDAAALKVGQAIKAGDILGSPAAEGGVTGLILTVKKEGSPTNFMCPLSAFDKAAVAQAEAQLRALENEWESFRGSDSVYAPDMEIRPGCVYSAMVEEGGQPVPPNT